MSPAPWRIRNVQKRYPGDPFAPPTHPDRGTVDWESTAPTDKYDPALVERMVALVRAMADPNRVCFPSASSADDYRDARAIVADLPAEVDGDLAEARKLLVDWEITPATRHMIQDLAVKAIRRGRELAGEGK